MNGPALVADHLNGHVDDVIAAWQRAQRRVGDVPRSEGLDGEDFADHVPELIDRMGERLRGEPSDVGDPGRKHGQVRWRQGYNIVEMVTELGHLRTALIDITFGFARQRDFDLGELEAAHRAINEVLNEALDESARQFMDEDRARQQSSAADLEARRLAVEEARQTAEAERLKLRTVLENLPAGVWVCDARGQIIAANREAEAIQGFPAAQTIGRVDINALGPEYPIFHPNGTPYTAGQVPMARALRGEAVLQEEIVWPLGEVYRLTAVNASPLRDSAQAIIGAIAVAQDITGARRSAAELAAASAQLNGILEFSPVMIWRSRPEGGGDYFNKTWLAFTGRPVEQELGEGWTGGVHPEDLDRSLAAHRDSLEHHAPFQVDYRLRRHDGQYRTVTDRGIPMHDPEGKFLGFLGSCLDIHDHIELEASLEQQRQLAEESSLHKTRLMSALSHDARTPLNAVFLSAQLLELHVADKADPEVQECLRTIRHSVTNVMDLLGDLLNLSRIDSGATPAVAERFALGETLAECLGSVQAQARLKGLSCRIEAGDLADAVVETDRTKVKQVLANLLSNALRYTERGSITLVAERKDDQLRLSVKDTGVGIAAADYERVFEEFATLENSHRAAGEGTGLGLAICRRLASLLKGEVTLDSAPGLGSIFTLVLPIEVLTDARAAAAGAPGPAGTKAGGAILIVEDHLASRQALARVLKRLGYRVLEAGNGRDALTIAREERPRAILMDVNMPIMDGIDATIALRADPIAGATPIFALTGDVSLVNQRRIGAAGVDGYLEKPVTREALLQALGTLDERG